MIEPGRLRPPPRAALAGLVDAVQANCDIADARHAADLSLCNYLLQMREFYRWAEGLPFDAVLDRDAVGQWLGRQEARWDAVQDQGWQPLPLDGGRFDAFDLDAVNARLIPQGLVYGAGLAGPGRAGFFLADLHALGEAAPGLPVQHCGAEHARGLFAPPAALQGGTTIVLRRESLARWLWERFEAFSLRRGAGPFAAVAEAYGLQGAADFVAALPRLVDEQSETLLLHEIGERDAARWLEPGWSELRLATTDRRSALQLRAVRDHVADLSLTLPTLLERGSAVALHFWFSTHEGLHAALFPDLRRAYDAWCGGDAGVALRGACGRGARHFSDLARELVGLRRDADAVRRLLHDDAAVCV